MVEGVYLFQYMEPVSKDLVRLLGPTLDLWNDIKYNIIFGFLRLQEFFSNLNALITYVILF